MTDQLTVSLEKLEQANEYYQKLLAAVAIIELDMGLNTADSIAFLTMSFHQLMSTAYIMAGVNLDTVVELTKLAYEEVSDGMSAPPNATIN